MHPRLDLCFGVHNHQPVGNFEGVVRTATAQAYHPFLEVVHRRPALRLTIHVTGNLLEWLRDQASATFDLLGEVVARGQVELLTGGFYEPILAILPDHDKVGQIRRLTDFIDRAFGVRPRGMWLAERVWEPQLPRALCEAGVEYVLLDDSHFALAGFDADAIGGYYLTEEQGNVLAVFPISQRLRYLIPFGEVTDSLAYLEERRGTIPAVTVVDDGEKFGAWPKTYDHVYRDGWLERFFDAVLDTPWITLTTFSDVLEHTPATGRVYLPAASYREMGEWALPAAAGRQFQETRERLASLPDGDRGQRLLPAGIWRSFLVKYPEVADTYWKMLRLSTRLRQTRAERPDDPRLAEAEDALWRGQANDAYWHGVFGGCYLPHLRRAVKQSLLACERRLAEMGDDPATWARGDANGDGREEILVRTRELTVTLNPERGGTLTELAWLPRGLDLADVLTRRFELYHGNLRGDPHLEYDEFRRASLFDAWFGTDGDLDPVAPWSSATVTVGGRPLAATVMATSETVHVRMRGTAEAEVVVDKEVTIGPNTAEVRYRLERPDGGSLHGRWGVQWNLALTGGEGSERYLDLPDRPALRSRGARMGLGAVALVDEWADVEVGLAWQPEAGLAWGPVETVSVSEGGLERIYQGTALLLTWRLDGLARADLRVSVAIGSRERRG